MPCWFFRFMISDAADRDKPLGAWTNRHVARCASCQRFHASCRRLGVALRFEASDIDRACGRLAGQGLAGPAGQPRLSRSALFGATGAVAACAAVAALTSILLLTRTARPPEQPASPVRMPGLARVQVTTALIGVLEGSLATEVERLTDDTESSVRFLVACLAVSPSANGVVQGGEQFKPSHVR